MPDGHSRLPTHIVHTGAGVAGSEGDGRGLGPIRLELRMSAEPELGAASAEPQT